MTPLISLSSFMIFFVVSFVGLSLAASINFAFNEAVKKGDLNEVLYIAKSEPLDLNWIPSHTSRYRPHLIEAVDRGNLSIARYLLDNCCNTNVILPDDNGRLNWSPISYAIDRQDTKMIVLLCEYNLVLDVTWQAIDGPLSSPWIGPQLQNPEVIQAYFRRCKNAILSGVDPNYRFSDDHLSIIDKFALYGTTDMIIQLMTLGANPNLCDEAHHIPPTIVLIAKHGVVDLCERMHVLVKNAANVNGRLHPVPYKYEHSPALYTHGRTALWYAVNNSNPELVGILIKLGADLTLEPMWGPSLLYNACYSGDLPISSMLFLRHLQLGRGPASLMKEPEGQQVNSFRELYRAVLATLPHNWGLLRMLFLLGSDYETEMQLLEFRHTVKQWHIEAQHIKAKAMTFILGTGDDLLPELRHSMLIPLFLEFMHNRVYGP